METERHFSFDVLDILRSQSTCPLLYWAWKSFVRPHNQNQIQIITMQIVIIENLTIYLNKLINGNHICSNEFGGKVYSLQRLSIRMRLISCNFVHSIFISNRTQIFVMIVILFEFLTNFSFIILHEIAS